MSDLDKLIKDIKDSDTKPKLDSQRIKIIYHKQKYGIEDFKVLQAAFIKQLNKLRRVPLKDRSW